MKIAIDGPAGSGKSTIARIIADKIGINYIDTGAMYRAITLFLIDNNISFNECCEHLQGIDLIFTDNKLHMNNTDVSDRIRSIEVTENVSEVSSIQCVREYLVAIQRKIVSECDVIMDGRDIGTVVMPNADYKFFLVADVNERAKRRMLELQAKGIEVDFEQLSKDIARRDHLDSTRDISPLVKAEDAFEIDTTFMSINDVVEAIVEVIKV